MIALEFSNVGVNYGPVQALEQASFCLEAGVLCGLIGVNGSGKSTLFKAAMGVEPLSSGSITVLGQSPGRARQSGLVSYMPQSERVDWTFPVSVREVVAMGRYRGLGITRRLRAQDRAEVDAALERVGLAELGKRQIGELSGGQKKRVFMARALAQKAQLFLLDEPFAGVDTASEALLIEVLKELRDDGATVLLATHGVEGLGAYADRAILLKNRVLLHDSPQVVLRPENLALAFGIDSAVHERGKRS